MISWLKSRLLAVTWLLSPGAGEGPWGQTGRGGLVLGAGSPPPGPCTPWPGLNGDIVAPPGGLDAGCAGRSEPGSTMF